MEFTLSEAIEFSRQGSIEAWVHLFLCSEAGHNRAFADGLKQQKRHWVGPVQIEFQHLRPCCGPSEGMEYQVSQSSWEWDMEIFRQHLNRGWAPPPLIAENRGDHLSVRDGNHRLEALKRAGFSLYWVIIWDNESPENLEKWRRGANDL